jgi:predicted phosphodiesterase
MRLAVISDIHGNWDALSAVLKDIDRSRVDDVVCLGDNIGYGPEPNRVIETLQECNIPSILGNHELAVIEPQHLSWFNPVARKSLTKTTSWLSDNSRAYIAQLDFVGIAHNCRLVHGFPPDSATRYYFEVSEIGRRRVFEAIKERLCFIGHTHDLHIISYAGQSLGAEILYDRRLQLSEHTRYIISVGSVGQPRDGDNNAKYVIWDTSDDTIEIKFVAYDIASVAKKITAANLPQSHADRLW